MCCCVRAQVVTYQPPFVLGAGAYTQINAIYPGNFVNNSGVTTTWQPAASRPTLPDAGLGIIAVSHLLFHSHHYKHTLLTSLCTAKNANSSQSWPGDLEGQSSCNVSENPRRSELAAA
jgi:hypothetical protein